MKHTLALLVALRLASRTPVIFITDNGSAFPVANANTYLASSRPPLLVRGRGVTKPGDVDRTHFVSTVDFWAPSMDATGEPISGGLDGRSLIPLLKGREQEGCDYVFTQIDHTIGGPSKPMRCVRKALCGHIFNAFSGGTFKYKNNDEGMTFAAMQEAGNTDPAIQARVEMFRYRAPEEFYDLEKDAGCTSNLIHEPSHQALVKKYQHGLREGMVETHDHSPAAFDVRANPAAPSPKLARNRTPCLLQPTTNRRSARPTAQKRENRRRSSRSDEARPHDRCSMWARSA